MIWNGDGIVVQNEMFLWSRIWAMSPPCKFHAYGGDGVVEEGLGRESPCT